VDAQTEFLNVLAWLKNHTLLEWNCSGEIINPTSADWYTSNLIHGVMECCPNLTNVNFWALGKQLVVEFSVIEGTQASMLKWVPYTSSWQSHRYDDI
jgi:hypothetical protein